MSRQPAFVRVPDFEIKYAQDYKVIYVTGAFGGVDPMEGRIAFYIDKMVPKMKEGGQPGEMEAAPKIIREFLVEIRMSPETFKEIAKWMMQHVERLGP